MCPYMCYTQGNGMEIRWLAWGPYMCPYMCYTSLYVWHTGEWNGDTMTGVGTLYVSLYVLHVLICVTHRGMESRYDDWRGDNFVQEWQCLHWCLFLCIFLCLSMCARLVLVSIHISISVYLCARVCVHMCMVTCTTVVAISYRMATRTLVFVSRSVYPHGEIWGHKHVHFRIGLFDGFWVSFMYNRPKLTFSVWGLSPQTENSAKSYDFGYPPVAMCLYY